MGAMLYIVITIFIGVFTGIVTGLTGASGVTVVVPLVNLLLKFSVHESIGTSLMVDVIASLAIAHTYHKYGNTDIKSGIWIAVGSVLGAQFSAFCVTGISGAGLGVTFGIFTVVMGAIVWKRGLHRESMAEQSKGKIKINTYLQRVMISLIFGFGVGIMTGFFGAGGGVMIFLILFFVLKLPLRMAIGTSTLIMTITACSGAIGYTFHGNINLMAGLIIGCGAVFGGVTSAKFVHRIDEQILAKVIGIIFIFLGILMICPGLI